MGLLPFLGLLGALWLLLLRLLNLRSALLLRRRASVLFALRPIGLLLPICTNTKSTRTAKEELGTGSEERNGWFKAPVSRQTVEPAGRTIWRRWV